MSGVWRRISGFPRCCLIIFAIASALVVSGPALYLRFRKSLGNSSCGPCVCKCPPPLSLGNIAPGLMNLSIPDCGRSDPELNKEMKKRFEDLLTEELELQEAVAREKSRHMNVTLLEAKRLASQYQKEVDKCNAATETCEEARERTEAALRKEKKTTTMWMHRAQKLGWQSE